jgi:alpha-glucosidase
MVLVEMPFRVLLLLVAATAALAGCRAGGKLQTTTILTSPSGAVRVELAVRTEEPTGERGRSTYSVRLNGREIIAPSSLSVRLADGTVLGARTSLEGVERRLVREEFEQFPGKRRHVSSISNEVTLALRDGTPGDPGGQRRWAIVVRAADDGVAIRYRFLGATDDGAASGSELVIAEERTAFRLPASATITALPLGSFTTSHEGRYLRGPASELPPDQLLAVPLLAEIPGAGCFAIMEACLEDYAGMYLWREPSPQTSPGGAATAVELVTRLSPRPDEPGVLVRATVRHESPWRVMLLADTPIKLLESDFLLALNDPCALDDISWIRPGKTTFPWWNAYVDPSAGFEVGLNTATMLHYIDFCAAAGIPYHTLDGRGDEAWYGGPIAWNGADPTRAIDSIDLPAVLRHAQEKSVGIRVWMHWRAAQAHMERAFPLYSHWGIKGVMLDFMDRDDQEMIAFLRRAIALAAESRLTVVLHGVAAPTGLERTYPNLLGSEGVWNLEYNKWDRTGCTPEHEMTAVFTRMLAGPMDFHQGGTRTVPVEKFEPRWEAPLVMGTPCRTLASYVVYQNHLPMAADYPSAYSGWPLLSAVASVPCTWDETRAIAGAVGEYVVIARRAGRTWWIGAMTNASARTVDVPLSLLGSGRFEAELYEDDPSGAGRMVRRTLVVGRDDSLRAALPASGGWVARLEESDGRDP